MTQLQRQKLTIELTGEQAVFLVIKMRDLQKQMQVRKGYDHPLKICAEIITKLESVIELTN